MADIPGDVVLIKQGQALLAFKRDEYFRAVRRGKLIRRCNATDSRMEKRLEKARREGEKR